VDAVRYSDYMKYKEAVTDAGNALMALLAGSQLATHFLQLTEGSNRLLPEIFPNVLHISRFNLKTENAFAILNQAEIHLSAMGVPYALSLHEDYMQSCLELLIKAGVCKNINLKRTSSSEFHEIFEKSTGQLFSADSKLQLSTLRIMRNCMMHNGGRANSSLINEILKWNSTLESDWKRLTQSSPVGLRIGEKIFFGHGEMILSLAVTKRIAHEANLMLQTALPKTIWADILISDLLLIDANLLSKSDKLRKSIGYSRFNFGPIGLSEIDIKDAHTRAN
jgi:hypothetical protein